MLLFLPGDLVAVFWRLRRYIIFTTNGLWKYYREKGMERNPREWGMDVYYLLFYHEDI